MTLYLKSANNWKRADRGLGLYQCIMLTDDAKAAIASKYWGDGKN